MLLLLLFYYSLPCLGFPGETIVNVEIPQVHGVLSLCLGTFPTKYVMFQMFYDWHRKSYSCSSKPVSLLIEYVSNCVQLYTSLNAQISKVPLLQSKNA